MRLAHLLVPVFLAATFGAAAQPATTAVTGAFAGADRSERLITGARREGSLTVYSSTAVADMTLLTDAFERAYGVKVNVWRGTSSDILQRSLTEARAGRNDVDVIETGTAEMEALHREGLLQEFRSPVFAELMPQAVAPDRPWVASRVSIYNLAYNTNLVRPADLPKSYADLADPKWRGKLGIESSDANWFMELATVLGEEEAVALFRDIVANNRASVRRGHLLLTNLVASGEIPLAINVYAHEVEGLRRVGAPIDELFLAPAIAQFAGIAPLKRAPHPFAAILFTDFLLTEGQRIWAEMERTPTNLKYQRLPPGVELNVVDDVKFVDESQKWERLFREILAGR